jgi:hypothetical protein
LLPIGESILLNVDASFSCSSIVLCFSTVSSVITFFAAGEPIPDSVEMALCTEKYRIREEQRDESDSRKIATPSEHDDNRDR